MARLVLVGVTYVPKLIGATISFHDSPTIAKLCGRAVVNIRITTLDGEEPAENTP